ncbi:MAG: siroheme synthase CysG [Pseudomonadota bacterium]
MDYLPLFAQLSGRRVALIGAGNVALRKARLLKRAGANLRVVAPAIAPGVLALADSPKDECLEEAFRPDHLDGCWFVVAATGSAVVNGEVFAAAAGRRMFCNSVDDVAHSSSIFPALVDRSPLLVAISSGGRAPVLVRRWRERLERLLPQRLGRLAQFIGSRRREVGERLPALPRRREFWERFVDGPVARRLLAGQIRGAAARFRRELEHDAGGEPPRGVAWLVGAGPGAADLLTLRALQTLQDADTVIHDRLISTAVLELARRDAEFIAVGKRAGSGTSQAAINALLVERVRAGQRVCRLKGGDPFVFGRGGEEVEALRAAGLDFEIVPGVTAVQGAAAYAGIPLTHRDHARSLHLVTAHDSVSGEPDWAGLAGGGRTLAFYMGVARVERIRDGLLAAGLAATTPFAVVERATTAEQRVLTGQLATLPEVARRERVGAPALIIVGAVAAFAREPGWFRPLPLESTPGTQFARA